MDLEQQTIKGYQRDLFKNWANPLGHGVCGNGGTGTATRGERQGSTASKGSRALAMHLMARIGDRVNLLAAYRKVKGNKGAPGVDGMTVDELGDWLRKHHVALSDSLLDGSYRPQPVRKKEIPKPGGAECVSWVFPRSWTVSCNRRFFRCWNRW